MYETLIMLKPGTLFTPDQMEQIVRGIAASQNRALQRDGTSTTLTVADSYLEIDFNDAPHVAEESREIASDCNIPCADCTSRFEMNGDDPDMELFNDYLLINEKLNATGQFIIFDQAEGELFGT